MQNLLACRSEILYKNVMLDKTVKISFDVSGK